MIRQNYTHNKYRTLVTIYKSQQAECFEIVLHVSRNCQKCVVCECVCILRQRHHSLHACAGSKRKHDIAGTHVSRARGRRGRLHSDLLAVSSRLGVLQVHRTEEQPPATPSKTLQPARGPPPELYSSSLGRHN